MIPLIRSFRLFSPSLLLLQAACSPEVEPLAANDDSDITTDAGQDGLGYREAGNNLFAYAARATPKMPYQVCIAFASQDGTISDPSRGPLPGRMTGRHGDLTEKALAQQVITAANASILAWLAASSKSSKALAPETVQVELASPNPLALRSPCASLLPRSGQVVAKEPERLRQGKLLLVLQRSADGGQDFRQRYGGWFSFAQDPTTAIYLNTACLGAEEMRSGGVLIQANAAVAVAHEIGHFVIGPRHLSKPEALMCGMQPGGTFPCVRRNSIALTAEDKAAAQQVFQEQAQRDRTASP